MSIYIVGGGAGVFVILNILLIFLEIGLVRLLRMLFSKIMA